MTEEAGRQHVVLCEGFDDRSFWAGWFLHLGCTDPTNRGEKAVTDAWGRPVKRGKYLLLTPAGTSVVVQPYQGRSKLRKAAKEYLRGQVYRPDRLILNLDSDAENGSEQGARQAIRGIVRHYDGVAIADREGSYEIDGVQLASVIWECEEGDSTPGVPAKQTLERLVTASVQAAYPDRGPVVDSWLEAEPQADVTIPKSYGYSYLAKWYARHGADDFYRAIWRDEAVAHRLRERLGATGAWAIVEDLVAD